MKIMKYLTQLLEGPKEAFEKLNYVYHYRRPENKTAPYAVWTESDDDAFNGDNARGERTLNGTLDFFAKAECDEIDDLEAAMESFGASWALTGVQFEEDTNLIHYSWSWSCV